jgi:Tol biopolymer transport system component
LILLVVKPSSIEDDIFSLWHLSYPGGKLRQLTDSLSFFERRSLSLTANSNALVAVQMQGTRNIWILPDADASRARQLTFDSVGYTGYAGLSLMPDGGIVYARLVNEQQTIWIMDAEGKNNNQLTPETYSSREPVVTSDGRYIVFQSNRTGNFEIWRMNTDGSDAKQLTANGNNTEPHCSPDGKWVVYHSGRDGTLWKISIDGGEPVQLTKKSSGWPQISPDGKLILCAYGNGLAVIPFDGGEPIKTFKLPRAATAKNGLRWLPDGKAFTIRGLAQGIWQQSLDGGEPEKLPNIGEEKIFNYIWSADGKDIICSRGPIVNTVVLIEGFK